MNAGDFFVFMTCLFLLGIQNYLLSQRLNEVMEFNRKMGTLLVAIGVEIAKLEKEKQSGV